MKLKIIIFMVLIGFYKTSFAHHTDVIIIKNNAVDENILSSDYLYNIYTLRITKWKDNTPITIVMLPSDNHNTIEFVLDVLKAPSLGKFIEIINIKDNEIRTVVFKHNDFEVIQYISNTKGSIGYVNGKIYKNSDGVDVVSIAPDSE